MVGESELLQKFYFHREDVRRELLISYNYIPVEKDILIVVHNQLEYLKICIESIRKETENYHIFIWDNASDQDTQEWLVDQKDIVVIRSEENLGFIIPNNELIKLGRSPYVILLNSDTMVFKDWDKAMIAHLQQDENLVQVGYMGGILNEEGKGVHCNFGSEVDYISGWSFCISRDIYNQFGLFDQENLEFAYAEDADFSLRLTEQGHKILALHLGLVHHFENKTILQVRHKRDCRASFIKNHNYIRQKWGHRIGCKALAFKSLNAKV